MAGWQAVDLLGAQALHNNALQLTRRVGAAAARPVVEGAPSMSIN
jgi:hypothetical protein